MDRDFRRLLLALGLLVIAAPAWGAPHVREVAAASIDRRGNVVVVSQDGKRDTLTRDGGYGEAAVSADRKSVVWSKKAAWGGTVFVYRDGRVRSIPGDPFIRGCWFVDSGRRIGVDTGGLHFAGAETLYDVASLHRLDSFPQATTPTEDRPSWSLSSDHYNGRWRGRR